MGDRAASVRATVAANPASPYQTFVTLAADEDEAVRQALANRLVALAPGLPGRQQDRIAHAAWEAMTRLAEDAAEQIRATIAEALKDLPDPPRALVLRLARDTSLRVADPLIRLCPLLTEGDLLTLIAAPPVAETLAAIARRPAISETVAEALVGSGDAAAIGDLLGNRSAAIRESTLDALVVQAAEQTSWQAPLVRRPDLTARAALALAQFVAEELLAPLMERADLPAEVVSQLRAAVATRLAGTQHPHETAEDAATRVAILQSGGALDDAAVLQAARRGETAFVVTALAGLADMPRSVIDHAVATRCGKSLAGLCRKAGLSDDTAEATVALLAPSPPALTSPAAVGDSELRWRINAIDRAARR
jgi:uncharacterized protein (DUF2336 family)